MLEPRRIEFHDGSAIVWLAVRDRRDRRQRGTTSQRRGRTIARECKRVTAKGGLGSPLLERGTPGEQPVRQENLRSGRNTEVAMTARHCQTCPEVPSDFVRRPRPATNASVRVTTPTVKHEDVVPTKAAQ